MPRPLVTIISPTYNQERYVAGCAESALAQTYADWEQIFVDDGSTDRTREVIAGFNDSRIKVLSLPHAGLGALERSYNAALAASRGSLVAILEGDDLWPADKLEKQVPSFDAPDTFLSWGRADLIDDHGTRIGDVCRLDVTGDRARLRAGDVFHRLTRSNILTPTVTVMVRREALERVGGFRQTGSAMLVDLPTWLWTTAMEDGYAEFVNQRLGFYRVHGAQTSQRRHDEMTREHFAIVRAVESELSADTLRRVGWDAPAQRRAQSRAQLAKGESLLAVGRFAEARAAFHDAFGTRASTADVALATLGMISAAAHVDLVRTAFAARTWLHRRRTRVRNPAND